MVVLDLVTKWVVASQAVLVCSDLQRPVLITCVNHIRRISKYCGWGGEWCEWVARRLLVEVLTLNRASACGCIDICAQRNYKTFYAGRCWSTSNTIFDFVHKSACGQISCSDAKWPIRASCWTSRREYPARTHYFHSVVSRVALLGHTSSADSWVEADAEFNNYKMVFYIPVTHIDGQLFTAITILSILSGLSHSIRWASIISRDSELGWDGTDPRWRHCTVCELVWPKVFRSRWAAIVTSCYSVLTSYCVSVHIVKCILGKRVSPGKGKNWGLAFFGQNDIEIRLPYDTWGVNQFKSLSFLTYSLAGLVIIKIAAIIVNIYNDIACIRDRSLGDSSPLLIRLKVKFGANWVVTSHGEHSIPSLAHVWIRERVEFIIVDPVAVIWSGTVVNWSSGAKGVFVFDVNHTLSGLIDVNCVGGYELKICFHIRPRLLFACGHRISYLSSNSVHTEPGWIALGCIVW